MEPRESPPPAERSRYPSGMTRAVPCRAESPIGRQAGLLLVAVLAPACGDNEIYQESVYAQRCVQPRAGIAPGTRQPYPDVAGTAMEEKLWVHSWIQDLYLWYREVPDVDLARSPTAIMTSPTAVDYFDQEKTPLQTASGKPKDQFHFIYDTPTWEALSQSGTEASYGIQWALLAPSPPRSLVIAYTQPGSPAAAANLGRGARVLSIDGIDVERGSDVDTLNEGLFPSNLNESHTFVVQDAGATTTRTVTLTSTSVEINPVLDVRTLPPPNEKVGYVQFTDHIATAEKALFDAFTKLRTAGITDLILDMRYNGGGYLDIASELAYMIAGPSATSGKTFERLRYNDRYPDTDPFSGMPLQPEGFVNQSLGFVPAQLGGGVPLPTLGLSRVFVLTSSSTCSASESVMNSLAGIDVQVIQIGETTCGKPYGFVPQDNCGTTYFAIQFQGVNNKGFGDYADGFVPGGVFQGCTVADDFTHALGDPVEARVAAALAYRAIQSCSQIAPRLADPRAAVSGALIPKPAWRENRIVRR
jgi:carboxyl-terminal processing protease